MNFFGIARPPTLWEVVVPIVFGIWFFAVAPWAAASALKWNSRFFRFWGFSVTQRHYEISFRIAGLLAIVFGLLILVRVI